MNFDPVAEDPVKIDLQYPAELEAVNIESEGKKLVGVLFIAQGAGPHPTVVLLHGFPGYDRNFDLAQVFRRAGWNVLVFHYRGSWGSEGTFSFKHVLEDVSAAQRFLSTRSARDLYRVDTDKIVLVGHSLGGFAALMTLAYDQNIRSAASIAGFNLGIFADNIQRKRVPMKGLIHHYEKELPSLRIPSAVDLFHELSGFGERWDLLRQAPKMAHGSVLLVGGSRDMDAPVDKHHIPLVHALDVSGARQLRHVILDADHYFSDKRVALARTILSWLEFQPIP
jgi:dipeptidyl aminopeptidase/acylaminoacyl peptidase